jgi:hypothetical protein
MVKYARITFGIGCITFLVIGVLHLYVHFAEMSGNALEQRFNEMGMMELQGDQIRLWDLFQGISILMGFFSAALGVALWGILHATPSDKVPNRITCIAMMILLAGISVVGAIYLTSFQLYGGIAGVVMFGFPFILGFGNAK